MIRNYLKTAFTQFWRNRIYTLIILLGWSVALFVAYNALVYAVFQFSFDKQHDKRDRTFIVQTYLSDFQTSRFRTPFLLSDALKNDIPEIEEVCRYSRLYSAKVIKDEESIRIRNIYAVDESIFNVFHLPLQNKQSHKGLLQKKNSIILSEKMAHKFFGNKEVIGKNIKITLKGKEFVFDITGILQNTPYNSSFRPEFLTNIEVSADEVYKYSHEETVDDIKNNWGRRDHYTYVLLPQNFHLEDVQAKVTNLETKYLPEKANIEWNLRSFASLHQDYYLDFTTLYILIIIGVLVLLVAGANYIVLGSAVSINRSKEIGLRKLVGATPKDIKRQFLGESILISILAVPISIILFHLFLPVTLPILGLPQEFVELHLIEYLPLFILLSIIWGGLSGIYVSIKLSGIQVIKVLKIKYLQLSSKSLFRNVLIVFQLFVIMCMLAFILSIKTQINYGQTKDQGFNKENIILINSGYGFPHYQAYLDKIKSNPNILQAGAAMEGPPTHSNMSSMYERFDEPDKEVRVEGMSVDYGFMEVFGFKLLEGRYFSRELASDEMGTILNQTAVEKLGIKDPIGKKLGYQTIIGVVEDFHLHSTHVPIIPLNIDITNKDYISQIALRFKAGMDEEVMTFLEETWKEFQSDQSIEFLYFDESLRNLYEEEDKLTFVISSIVAIISIIALSGLVGLTLFMVKYKQKEVGLRKLFGAPITHIRKSIFKEFSYLLLIAWLISLAPSWLIIQSYLELYAYKTTLNIWIFILPLLITSLVVFLSILIYINKLVRTNVVEILKDE